MHSSEVLSGPVYLFFLLIAYGTGALSLFVVVDSVRLKRTPAFERRPWTRWAWMLPQALYLIVFVIENLPWTSSAFFGSVLVFATLPALVQQIVYLLTVVYPKPIPAPDELYPDSPPGGDE